MKIKYEFVDGTVSEVEVEESIGAVIIEDRRLEDNLARKERYHCHSLDAVEFEGTEYGTLETPDFFRAFFAALRDLLLNLVVFMPRRPVRICVVEALRAGSTEAEKEKQKAPVLPVQDRLALNRALEAFFNTRGAASGEITDAHLAELSFSAHEPLRPEEPPRYFWLLLHKRSADRRPRS